MKLDASKVKKIRALKGSLTAKEVANRFSISASTVYSIWERRIWANVE